MRKMAILAGIAALLLAVVGAAMLFAPPGLAGKDGKEDETRGLSQPSLGF